MLLEQEPMMLPDTAGENLHQRPNDIRHTVGRRARRKKPEILPSSVHQINVAGMVDRIVVAGRRNLDIIDFVRTGRPAGWSSHRRSIRLTAGVIRAHRWPGVV